MRHLPKIDMEDPAQRAEIEPCYRPFEFCPDCGRYINPGFRTDACPHCAADFRDTPEFKALVDEWKQTCAKYGVPVLTKYDLGICAEKGEDGSTRVVHYRARYWGTL